MTTDMPMPPRRWLLRLGLPLVVIAIAAAFLVTAGWWALAPAVSVNAVTVVIRDVETTEAAPAGEVDAILAPGWVEPAPFDVYAGALVQGVVEDVLVLEGDRVSKGQPVATLVDDEAVLHLRRGEADLALAQGRLADARAVEATLDPQIRAAESRVAELDDEYRRKSALVESGAVARGPVQRLRFKLDAARASVQQLDAQRAVLAAKVETARATALNAAAARDDAALALERHTVRSPIDGVVIERLTSPGSVVRYGGGEGSSHIVNLYDPASLQVRADVPLAEAARVGVGHPAEIVVDVLPDMVFTGEVSRFLHRADLQKNTVEAKVAIHAPSELLKPDMLARVRILQPEAAVGETVLRRVPRVFIPESALREGDRVLVIEDYERSRGTANSRVVRTGDTIIDGWIEIVSGLSAGDRVLVDELPVAAGTRVQVSGEEH